MRADVRHGSQMPTNAPSASSLQRLPSIPPSASTSTAAPRPASTAAPRPASTTAPRPASTAARRHASDSRSSDKLTEAPRSCSAPDVDEDPAPKADATRDFESERERTSRQDKQTVPPLRMQKIDGVRKAKGAAAQSKVQGKGSKQQTQQLAEPGLGAPGRAADSRPAVGPPLRLPPNDSTLCTDIARSLTELASVRRWAWFDTEGTDDATPSLTERLIDMQARKSLVGWLLAPIRKAARRWRID